MRTLILTLVIAAGSLSASPPGGDQAPRLESKQAVAAGSQRPDVSATKKNPPPAKTAGTTSAAAKSTTPRAPVCRPCRPAYLFM